MKKQKTEVMVAKRERVRRRISLSSKKEENYESDIGDKINPGQAGDDKNLLQFYEGGTGGNYKQQLNYHYIYTRI